MKMILGLGLIFIWPAAALGHSDAGGMMMGGNLGGMMMGGFGWLALITWLVWLIVGILLIIWLIRQLSR